MKISQDLHIHSHHSCDGAKASLDGILDDRKALGVEHFAVTDHLHSRYNLSDIESCRHEFLGWNFPDNYHFGVEVSLLAQWECDRIADGDYIAKGDVPIYGFRDDERPFDGRICLDFSEEQCRKYGVEFVVAGVHWPLGYPDSRSGVIDNYFQQQMFIASHPLVDVVAHPWDSLALAGGDWFRHRDNNHIDHTIYREIPPEMNTALANEILKNGKLAELNLSCILECHEEVSEISMDIFAQWREMGVKFTCGSDQHSEHPDPELFARMEKLLDKYGFTGDDFALPF